MKTLSPEFAEAFVESCLQQGMGERATAVLLHRAQLEEALTKDASFREGFIKAAGSAVQVGDTVDPGFGPAAGWGLGGLLGGALLGRFGGAGLGKLIPKLAPKLTKALTLGGAATGGVMGAHRGYTNALKDEKWLPGDSVNLPSWMMRGPQTTAGATPTIYKGSPYGFRPKGLGNTAPGSTPTNPMLPAELVAQQKKVKGFDTQIETLQKGIRPGSSPETDVSNYRTRMEIDRLTKARASESAAYQGLLKNFEADKTRTMSELGGQYNATGAAAAEIDPNNWLGQWLNKSDPNTVKGWLANQWARLNRVPERAEWDVAARKTLADRQAEFARVYRALQGLNPEAS